VSRIHVILMRRTTQTRVIPLYARTIGMVAVAVLLAGCSSSPGPKPRPAEPSPTVNVAATAMSVGGFPAFPKAPLPEPAARSLQAALDGFVENGTVDGVTAAIVVAGSGNWSGASGVDAEGKRLTPETRLLTASVGKTVTAAEIMRLVDEGSISLDDPLTDHLSAKAVAAFDANGATIRDVLGMRSGIADPPGYEKLLDSGATTTEVLEKTLDPSFPAGSEISYQNINYVLLGMVIERVSGRPLWQVLHSGVLDGPGLAGLAYPVKDALAGDGEQVETDAAALARWGYELYGGSILSNTSLREMTDFRGDWYGLGAIDFARAPVSGGYDRPAVGHGGLEPGIAAVLVAFPELGVVVAVQAAGSGLELAHAIVKSLIEAIDI
jgi:D-alanyl-D-alanine carboxypeptidase